MTIQKAFVNAGSASQLAKTLSESDQLMYNWKKRGVPAERVLDVCRAVDWKSTPHELRPDLYPNTYDGLPVEKLLLMLNTIPPSEI